MYLEDKGTESPTPPSGLIWLALVIHLVLEYVVALVNEDIDSPET